MCRGGIVSFGVRPCEGEGPKAVSGGGDSPSFFSRLSDAELMRVVAFELAHSDCVYFWRFNPDLSELYADCYTCDLTRDLKKGGDIPQ